MNEPTIVCPSCKTEIKLTESLAGPLVESTRQKYEQKIAEKEHEVLHIGNKLKLNFLNRFSLQNIPALSSQRTINKII